MNVIGIGYKLACTHLDSSATLALMDAGLQSPPPHAAASGRPAQMRHLPPEVYFVTSAIFHYVGPAFAVLLFAYVEPLGVAWLRIASAAAIFVVWQRPWRCLRQLDAVVRRRVILLGFVLGAMNVTFYLALDRLPLATVGAIEFLGPIGLAALGTRSIRNGLALLLAVFGVYVLTDMRFESAPLGYVFAFANCLFFVLYIVIGHRVAADGGAVGIERLGAAMLVAAFATLPFGFADAVPAMFDPLLLGAAIGVGVCSSVIPYICDQLAMARLARSSFALMLALLPAVATIVGVVLLAQIPTPVELVGIGLVIVGVAVHRSAPHHGGSD
jgi:inner membrane transporter RhtA